jgi:hypothetical protein
MKNKKWYSDGLDIILWIVLTFLPIVGLACMFDKETRVLGAILGILSLILFLLKISYDNFKNSKND